MCGSGGANTDTAQSTLILLCSFYREFFVSEINIEVNSFDNTVQDIYKTLLPEQAQAVNQGLLAWKFYHQAAAMAGLFAVARDKDTVVGLNAFMGLRIKFFDEENAIAFQSMDTIIHPKYRGCGLFTRLIRAFYDTVVPQRVLLYGFPNAHSAHGFFNKLGWQRLGAPPFLIKPLRTGYFLKRFFGSTFSALDIPLSRIKQRSLSKNNSVFIEQFDARFDRFWSKVSAQFSCAVHRDSQYLNWRIAAHPTKKYTTKAFLSRDGEIQAFITYILLDKHEGKIAYIMEALSLPEAQGSLISLFNEVINECNKNKVDCILGWCASHASNYKAYRSSGFLPLPQKLAPIKLNFGAKLFIDNKKMTYRDWYVSYLDSDTV